MERSSKHEKLSMILMLVKNSLFSFRRSNASLVVAILGASIGVFSLIAITGTMNGMQSLLIDSLIEVESYDYQGVGSIAQKNEIASNLTQSKNITEIVAFVDEFALLKAHTKSDIAHIRAIDFAQAKNDIMFLRALSLDKQQFENFRINIVDGLYPIMIGWSLSTKLGLNVGDRIRMLLPGSGKGFIPQEIEFVVSNIFFTGSSYDLSWAFIRLDDYTQIVGKELDLINFGARVNSDRNAKSLLSASLENVESWQEKNSAFYVALKSEKVMLIILSAVIFGIITLHFRFAMFRRIRNKKDDIVSLRSMGASPRQITYWFFAETIAVAFISTILGTSMGMLYIYGIQEFVEILSRMFGFIISLGGSNGIGTISMREVINIIIFTWLAMFLSAWSVIQRSTRFAPMQVLRYE